MAARTRRDLQKVRFFWILGVIVAFLGSFPTYAAPLDEYIALEDPNWGYSVQLDQPGGDGLRLLQVQFTSQGWKGTVWSHRLLMVIPEHAKDPSTGMLYISGSGRGADELEAMKAVAKATQMPTAALMDIPNQPLFDGLREDALIAYTFTEFVETKDPSWILLFPMTKGAVKAMDVFQAVAEELLDWQIDSFIVTGASKRGWTTWLTGAVDERVIAIAPIVYNNLNLIPQLELQERTFARGASPKIDDYTELGLLELINSPDGELLAENVDPYSYLERFTMPKMLLHGTNDPYWPVDALNLYWEDLPGEKYVINFANGGHDLGDLERALRSLAAFALHVTQGPVLSELEWQFDQSEERKASLHVKKSERTVGATLWVAISWTRDMTGATWTSLAPQQTEEGWLAQPMTIAGSYVAFYMDVEYAVAPDQTVSISTPIFLLEPQGR